MPCLRSSCLRHSGRSVAPTATCRVAARSFQGIGSCGRIYVVSFVTLTASFEHVKRDFLHPAATASDVRASAQPTIRREKSGSQVLCLRVYRRYQSTCIGQVTLAATFCLHQKDPPNALRHPPPPRRRARHSRADPSLRPPGRGAGVRRHLGQRARRPPSYPVPPAHCRSTSQSSRSPGSPPSPSASNAGPPGWDRMQRRLEPTARSVLCYARWRRT
jgi:hypothetical protein